MLPYPAALPMSRTPALHRVPRHHLPGPRPRNVSIASTLLQDIPAGSNMFSLIESAQAEVTTDRFNSGGLNAGEPERASAFLASWSQTRYSIGDALISSPIDGTPMVFPELALWEPIDVATDHRRPHDRPDTAQARTARRCLKRLDPAGALTQASSSSRPPAIAQLGDFAHISGMVTGDAMNTRLSFTVGGVFTRATTFERHGERQRDTRSAFLNWSFAPSRQHTFARRGIGATERAPFSIQLRTRPVGGVRAPTPIARATPPIAAVPAGRSAHGRSDPVTDRVARQRTPLVRGARVSSLPARRVTTR